MRLTDLDLRQALPRPKPYRLSDGAGLELLVNPRGSRRWRLRYRYAGRACCLSIGPYPAIGLDEARRERDKLRAQLALGDDPMALQRDAARRQRLAAGETFSAVAEEWIAAREEGWKPVTVQQVRQRLALYLTPTLGHRRIADIQPMDLLEVLRKLERRGCLRTVWALHGLLGMMMRYAVATGRRTDNPVAVIAEALRPHLRRRHYPALAPGELPELFARMSGRMLPRSELAFRFLLLTMVRTQEMRFAAWREFEDLDGPAPLWRIPASRMKMNRPHLVPLSPQAVAVLAAARALSGKSPYVFPGRSRARVIGKMTVTASLRRVGLSGRATVHGFRGTASTVLNEEGFNADWIEAQLSHRPNSVRTVYNFADYLPAGGGCFAGGPIIWIGPKPSRGAMARRRPQRRQAPPDRRNGSGRQRLARRIFDSARGRWGGPAAALANVRLRLDRQARAGASSCQASLIKAA